MDSYHGNIYKKYNFRFRGVGFTMMCFNILFITSVPKSSVRTIEPNGLMHTHLLVQYFIIIHIFIIFY